MEELKEYICHFVDLSDSEWQELTTLFTPVTYEKGEHIYGKTEKSEALYFITDGIVRSYKLEENGKDFTWTFHCLNMDTIDHRMLMDVVVVDYVSFTKNVPEELAFEALEDTTLMKINKSDLLALYASSAKWQKFATTMAEDSYAVMRERTFNLLTKNAKERLERLIQYYPGIFEKNVKMEHLASYLGITRQALNRLQRDVTS